MKYRIYYKYNIYKYRIYFVMIIISTHRGEDTIVPTPTIRMCVPRLESRYGMNDFKLSTFLCDF